MGPFMDLEEETACQDDDPMQQLQLANRCRFDEYVAADDGVQCSPMPTIQDIVSSVTQISEEGEETDDVGDTLPPVTYTCTNKHTLLSKISGLICCVLRERIPRIFTDF